MNNWLLKGVQVDGNWLFSVLHSATTRCDLLDSCKDFWHSLPIRPWVAESVAAGEVDPTVLPQTYSPLCQVPFQHLSARGQEREASAGKAVSISPNLTSSLGSWQATRWRWGSCSRFEFLFLSHLKSFSTYRKITRMAGDAFVYSLIAASFQHGLQFHLDIGYYLLNYLKVSYRSNIPSPCSH